jgi:hypothetical protein
MKTGKGKELREVGSSSEVDQQTLLIRDDATKVLMIVDIKKVSPAKKKGRISPGEMVAWQNNDRERWRGVVLAIGKSSSLDGR